MRVCTHACARGHMNDHWCAHARTAREHLLAVEGMQDPQRLDVMPRRIRVGLVRSRPHNIPHELFLIEGSTSAARRFCNNIAGKLASEAVSLEPARCDNRFDSIYIYPPKDWSALDVAHLDADLLCRVEDERVELGVVLVEK